MHFDVHPKKANHRKRLEAVDSANGIEPATFFRLWSMRVCTYSADRAYQSAIPSLDVDTLKPLPKTAISRVSRDIFSTPDWRSRHIKISRKKRQSFAVGNEAKS